MYDYKRKAETTQKLVDHAEIKPHTPKSGPGLHHLCWDDRGNGERIRIQQSEGFSA